MSQIDCVNLLAFIQVTVAFNFGLLCFKGSHIFKDLHIDLLNELGNNVRSTRENVEKEIDDLKSSTNNYDRKTKKPYLESRLARLRFLIDSQQANWGKYSILGMCGGLYGMMVLLLIGMKGSSLDCHFRDFLLISAELLFVCEIVSLWQLRKSGVSHISNMVMMRKLIIIIVLLILAGLLTLFDWSFRILPNFQVPFILLTIGVVFMPVLVYVFKVVQLKHRIDIAERDCNKALGIK